MGWDEVKKINSDMKVPLDVYQYLNDYRLWGEDSYVYQDKSKLHKLYETTVVSMNDLELSGEALEYLTTANKHIGKALGSVYGIERKDTLSNLSTMSAVANSSTAMSAVINSSTAMSAVANSSTAMSAVANSSTAMSAVINSSTAMSAVINSSTAMSAVANSSTAMSAVINSSTAMTAVLNSSTAMTAVANSSTAMTAVLNSSTAMTAVANSSTAMTAVANSSTAMQAVFNKEEMMTCILNSTNCMLLKNTGLPNANGLQCYGKFILIGSTYQYDCVDSCIPDYRSLILNKHSKVIDTSKFGKIFVKIGVPGVPLNTVYTMLDDANGGNLCVVYKL